jgi:hypothetical protein
MKDPEPPRQMRTRMAIALAYFTGITLIVSWSLPDGGAADRRAELAMRLPDTGVSGATPAPAKPMPVTGGTRSNVNCAGCGVIETVRSGVIEAVRTIDTRDEFRGRCDVGEFGRPHVSGNVFAAGGRDVESLADTVAATIADEHGVKKAAVTKRHQIVVRFRDGTRYVLDEATPRTLRVGDRIKVIAGAAGATG